MSSPIADMEGEDSRRKVQRVEALITEAREKGHGSLTLRHLRDALRPATEGAAPAASGDQSPHMHGDLQLRAEALHMVDALRAAGIRSAHAAIGAPGAITISDPSDVQHLVQLVTRTGR